MAKKFKAMEDKINELIQNKHKKPKTSKNFYPRVVTKTNITFPDDELEILKKRPKMQLK